jgi:hypothetical protein
MPDPAAPNEFSSSTPVIDLRDPWLAAFLAWLLPGLGHMYQRRWGKGGLFMACILGTFFYGLWFGGGRVVYASFREPDFREWRWAYVAQVANGLPALPAVVQAIRTGKPNYKAPLFDGFMAPPMQYGELVPAKWVADQNEKEDASKVEDRYREYNLSDFSHMDAPPNQTPSHLVYRPAQSDQTAKWHFKYGAYFDLGTVFTVIAGLLNILAIWDAWGGPMVVVPKPKSEKSKKGEAGDADQNKNDETETTKR